MPGESYLPVLDALHDSPIESIVCRHEGGAAMMAEAGAKLSSQPGVCFVTRGPGACNASSGLHVAQQDSTPLILFIGQVSSGIRERDAFQEVDYKGMFGSMAKWVAQIDDPARIDEFVSRAFHTATSGRPGPVVLALPEDTLSAHSHVSSYTPWQQLETAPAPADVQTLISLLQKAARPMIIAGGSRWSKTAVQQLQDFSTALQIPVCCSFRRQHLFDHHHPHYAGDVGIGLNPTLSQRLHESDLLVLLGGRLSEMPSQNYTLLNIPAPDQALVHIHPAAEELGKLYQATLAINASPVALMSELVQHSPKTPENNDRRDYILDCRRDYETWSTPDVITPGDVQMASVMRSLQTHTPDNTIITNGAGNYASWIHRFWRFNGYASQLAPTSGSMGYGLPAAIAAKLARPEACVIAFAGDGCLQMTLQELGTSMQYHAPIIVIVVDNGMYGTIRMHQEIHYPGRVSATELHNPDFVALARAYGALGLLVTHTDDFHAALQQALQSSVTSLIHIKIDPEAITPTTTLTRIRAKARASD